MARLPALPGFYELAAERGWQAIDFISDLHLASSTPRTVQAWAAYLEATPADAIFILGDLFEVWIGDDARAPGSLGERATDLMARAAGRRCLGFMAGNRDFLIGAAMLREAGLLPLPDPTVLDAWGQRVLLSHGDMLCLEDTEYQRFRAQVRSDHWRADFLAKPIAERSALARQMREASQARKTSGARPELWADVDTAAAVAWMHAAGARDLVHGHTHRPASQVLAPGYTRHVLSDWDLDTPPHRAQALRLTRDGFSRVDLANKP